MDVSINAEIILYYDENLGAERAILSQIFALRYAWYRKEMLEAWIQQLEALKEAAEAESLDYEEKNNE